MVIAGKRYLGEHDWYLEGARFLLDHQEQQGCWTGRRGDAEADEKPPIPGRVLPGPMTGDPLLETSFAVLFLHRATLRPTAPLLRGHRAPR